MLNQYLLKDREVIDQFDVALVVAMLNSIAGTSELDELSESSALGAEILELCRRLKHHKRPVVCLGGRRYMWGPPDKWDSMCRKAILLCRSQGVACIDGEQYSHHMTRMGGGWHVGKTTESYKLYLKLVEHVRNVAYSIWPQGT